MTGGMTQAQRDFICERFTELRKVFGECLEQPPQLNNPQLNNLYNADQELRTILEFVEKRWGGPKLEGTVAERMTFIFCENVKLKFQVAEKAGSDQIRIMQLAIATAAVVRSISAVDHRFKPAAEIASQIKQWRNWREI